MSHRDIGYDADADSEYECLHCGEIVSEDSHPGTCSDCGTAMRNRQMPYE
ncbi:rubrerythrin-like domain-containing protein [Halorussus caseinilyticus]|uniref:Rubrerythrin-like domain-containing protein n=1 Tax=Halorussus caseinilyticus TaxID=3034025 RepID=A0ABD5WGT6_9EURY|nr:rubrerythrin-like domain-containing protein [Halorussus sp. DT72]